MVAAHMDEVGFIVKGINADGTLRFAPVGGIVHKILPAMRVTVGACPPGRRQHDAAAHGPG